MAPSRGSSTSPSASRAAAASLVPWVVFAVAATPAMLGAIGSAGVALLAPIAMRLAERCAIDRRLIGLMVVHGAAAGNFSPLNVLGAIVRQAVTSRGLEMSVWPLFFGNLAYNVVLGVVIVAVFGGTRLRRAVRHRESRLEMEVASKPPTARPRPSVDQLCTLAAIVAVAVASLGFGLALDSRRWPPAPCFSSPFRSPAPAPSDRSPGPSCFSSAAS